MLNFNFVPTYHYEIFTCNLENFDPIVAPKTPREIREIKRNEKQIEIILKNYDEILRRRLINKYKETTGIIFGFLLKMVTHDLNNQNRDFMLKYYLNDAQFDVYEYKEKNSGNFIVILKYLCRHFSFVVFINIVILKFEGIICN